MEQRFSAAWGEWFVSGHAFSAAFDVVVRIRARLQPLHLIEWFVSGHGFSREEIGPRDAALAAARRRLWASWVEQRFSAALH